MNFKRLCLKALSEMDGRPSRAVKQSRWDADRAAPSPSGRTVLVVGPIHMSNFHHIRPADPTVARGLGIIRT